MLKTNLTPAKNRIRLIEELAEQKSSAARLAGERARDRGAAVQLARRRLSDAETGLAEHFGPRGRDALEQQVEDARIALARAEEERDFAARRYAAAAEEAQAALAARDAVRKYCRVNGIVMPDPVVQIGPDGREAQERIYA